VRNRIEDHLAPVYFMFTYKNGTPELNFSCEPTHQLAVVYRGVAKNFYGAKHCLPLYRGSSTRGYYGIVFVQRYLHEFNGIAIGRPVSNETAIRNLQEAWLGMVNWFSLHQTFQFF
jgi:hypothetical protein